MNPVKLTLITFFTLLGLTQASKAGRINIVNLAENGDLVVTVSYGKVSQNLVVKPNSFSGAFSLPETEVTLTAALGESVVIKIEPTHEPYLVVLKNVGEKAEWQLIPSKPAGEEWAFRIVNLSKLPLPLLNPDNPAKELPPGSETSIPVENKGQVRLKVSETESFSYEGVEPSAVVALVYRNSDFWSTVFVPEF